MNEELKPCPFCGGRVEITMHTNRFGKQYVMITCQECKKHAGRFILCDEKDIEKNLIKEWKELVDKIRKNR